MKRDQPSREAVRAAGRRATRASAKIEGRVVPDSFVRSAAAQAYLDQLKLTSVPNDSVAESDEPPESADGDS